MDWNNTTVWGGTGKYNLFILISSGCQCFPLAIKIHYYDTCMLGCFPEPRVGCVARNK